MCDTWNCTRNFGIFERRHHCRKCGGVFCGEHSARTTLLLDTSKLGFMFPPRGVPVSYFETPFSPLVEARVCDGCHDQLHGIPTRCSPPTVPIPLPSSSSAGQTGGSNSSASASPVAATPPEGQAPIPTRTRRKRQRTRQSTIACPDAGKSHSSPSAKDDGPQESHGPHRRMSTSSSSGLLYAVESPVPATHAIPPPRPLDAYPLKDPRAMRGPRWSREYFGALPPPSARTLVH